MRSTQARPWAQLSFALALGACVARQPSASVERAPAAGETAGDAASTASPNAPRSSLLLARAEVPPCVEPGAVSDRDAAIDTLLSGRALEATAAFEGLLAARPWDLAAAYLRGAAQAMAEDDNARAAAEMERLPLVSLESPRLDAALGSTSAPTAPAVERSRTVLTVASVEPNLITDAAAWLAAHPPADRSQLAAPPAHVAATFRGHPFMQVFGHADHSVALYAGAWLVASAPGKQPRAFQVLMAALPTQPLEITGAQLAGELLLVQFAYNGYASLSGGRNAYLVAFDATSGAVRWQSPPLSANAGNFVVLGRSVITGYGFTAEPDFVFNFDLDTGAQLQKLPVKSGPDAFAVDGQRLYVRTYDKNYAFDIQGPTDAAAGLQPARARSEARLHPNIACHLRAAAAAVDGRDVATLQRARDALLGDPNLPPWIATVLQAAVQHLPALVAGKLADLWLHPPQLVPAPPWEHRVLMNNGPAATPPPTLVRVRGEPADPVRALEPQPLRPDKPYFLAPVDDGRLPPGAAPSIVPHYGLESLRAIIPSGEHTLLIYGGRYLLALRGSAVDRGFDLDALRHPPRADPRWQEFASQDATYAQVVGDTLYVCNGGGSYAREVFGKKGFVTAIDLATGALRWRSDPLRCNATFAVYGEYLVTGYGFTAEPDYLFLLRMRDGATVAREKLESGPDQITLDGTRVHVEAYGHSYDFELRQ